MATASAGSSGLTTCVNDSDGSSRCVATAEVPAGASLLASPPLVAVLLEDQRDERCARCFRLLKEESPRCRRCQLERYCSIECQNAAWAEYHGRLCPSLPGLQYACKSSKLQENQSHAVCLLAKLVARHFLGEDAPGRSELQGILDLDVTAIRQRLKADPLASSNELELFFSFLPAELKEEEEIILDIVHDALKTPLRQLRFLLERFGRNNHVLSDEMLKPFAHAVLPRISRSCDHSCVPNAVVSTLWDQAAGSVNATVRTIRSLAPGSALNITYLDPILPLVERQTFLFERYHFTCSCPLCVYQGAIPAATKAASGVATPDKLSRVLSGTVGGHLASAGKALKGAGDFGAALNAIVLPTGPPVIKVPSSLLSCLKPEVVFELTGMFEEAAGNAQWEVACVTGSHILGIYAAVYGWTYPLTGLHMLELSKTLFNAYITQPAAPTGGELLRQATTYAIWARSIFRITCPTEQGGLCHGRLPMQDVGTLFEALEQEWKD